MTLLEKFKKELETETIMTAFENETIPVPERRTLIPADFLMHENDNPDFYNRQWRYYYDRIRDQKAA